MSRQFIIVDPSEEYYLLISQYLSMGWHDADIDEMSLDEVSNNINDETDAILLCGFEVDNEQVSALLDKSMQGAIPPLMVLTESDDEDDDGLNNILSLESLTPAKMNGALADLMKHHADGGFKKVDQSGVNTPVQTRADNELPVERLEGLRGYRLIRELGRGGMSRVYLATDNNTGKEVAIKVLDMDTIDDDRMIDRFIREYNMLASVDNIHVARILDQTFTDEYAFIIMERFEGGDLTRKIRKGISPNKAVNYLGQIADGLADVHDQGIVHRDLKPGNILFRADDTLAILDFGLAQMDTDEDLTKHGEVYGTPSYVSPEQARGKRVDHRSDLYSTGIIFYQMLTKKKPYKADNPMAMFYKHVHAELPKFPAPFEIYQPVLDKLLAKSVDDRYQNAGELLSALQDYQ